MLPFRGCEIERAALQISPENANDFETDSEQEFVSVLTAISRRMETIVTVMYQQRSVSQR